MNGDGEAGRYHYMQVPADPWRNTATDMCNDCGAWVASREVHDRHHDRSGLSPDQLRAAANVIRSRVAPARQDEPVGDYVAATAIHCLADALDQLADSQPLERFQ